MHDAEDDRSYVIASAREYIHSIRSASPNAIQESYWRLVAAIGRLDYAEMLAEEEKRRRRPPRAKAGRVVAAIVAGLSAILIPAAIAVGPRHDAPVGLERLCRSPEVVAWTELEAAARRHGVERLTEDMYRVIWRESRFDPLAVSRTADLGVAQFQARTWRWMIGEMKRTGRLIDGMLYSPIDVRAATDVMAWAWSRGLRRHWRLSGG